MSSHFSRLAFPLLLLGSVLAPRLAAAQAPDPLSQPLDRRAVIREALARNPALRVPERRADAVRARAKAEGTLPPPEIMGQVWQVPLSQPTAFDRQMIMVGVTQTFPAPGSLAARERATLAEADLEVAAASDR